MQSTVVGPPEWRRTPHEMTGPSMRMYCSRCQVPVWIPLALFMVVFVVDVVCLPCRDPRADLVGEMWARRN
jgi:hypothetical protein